MVEGEIKLLPLQAGDARMEPQHCKENLGSSGCLKKINGGRCPTNCLKTNICGGWKPREGKLPTRALFAGKLKSEESRAT